jgi:hypothetical protein
LKTDSVFDPHSFGPANIKQAIQCFFGSLAGLPTHHSVELRTA